MSEIDAGGVGKLLRMLTTADGKNEKSLTMLDDLLTWVEEAGDQVRDEFSGFCSELRTLQADAEGQAEGTTASIQQGTTTLEAGVGRLDEATETVESAHDACTSKLEESESSLRERAAGVQESFASSAESLSKADGQLGEDGETLRQSLDSIDQAAAATSQQLDGSLSDCAEGFETAAEAVGGEVLEGMREAGDAACSELQSQAGACQESAETLGTRVSGTYQAWDSESEGAKVGLAEALSGCVGQTVQNLLDAADGQLQQPCDHLHHQAVAPTQDQLGSVLEAAEAWTHETSDLSTATDHLDRGHQAKERLDEAAEG